MKKPLLPFDPMVYGGLQGLFLSNATDLSCNGSYCVIAQSFNLSETIPPIPPG